MLTTLPTPSLLRNVSYVSFPGIKLCLPGLVSMLMSVLWFLHRICPQSGRNLRLQSRGPRPRGLPRGRGHEAGHLYPGSRTAVVVSKLEGGRMAGQGPESFPGVALREQVGCFCSRKARGMCVCVLYVCARHVWCVCKVCVCVCKACVWCIVYLCLWCVCVCGMCPVCVSVWYVHSMCVCGVGVCVCVEWVSVWYVFVWSVCGMCGVCVCGVCMACVCGMGVCVCV